MRPAGLRPFAARTSATIALATVALLHLPLQLGCGASTPNTADAEPSAPVAEPPPPPVACGPLATGELLTRFDGARCPWTAVAQGSNVQLSSAEPEGAVSFSGAVPEACREATCTLRGLSTVAGPLLVLERPGAQSEVPQGVWIGHVSGDALLFVDLWQDAGDDVFDGGVALGPAHALAPFSCGGALAWFAAARTVAGESFDAPPSLRAREGAAGAANGGPLDRASCTPLALELP